MSTIDLGAFRATPLETDPFDYLVVPRFVPPENLSGIIEDFPSVPGPGSHPPSLLKIKGAFADLLSEMDAEPFRRAVEEKFSIDLAGRPTMFTVRGFCRLKDGNIHPDSRTKIITVLLYLNEEWEAEGGRLRILRSGTDLNDAAAEVPPHGGTLLAFRRSDTSWHGHEPFEGRRRAIQMNWVTDAAVVAHEQRRHRLSTRLKKLNPFQPAG
ncbi:hypothetical protein GGD81_000134 [Rhodobium orientis]|uniref:Prolyl 4-hydroxylase alpha subunit Fe(2+) 2OG dioxygenase domain-containing protein n=1 Tax=Rhodobium orientis TaxID=34017 RepID=A0A327JWZ5_9HYPH|nr:2OG-Fe(II) oxygenase [Rhodobium orientis]MBB4301119.1 hypothetical protein [Rhodobium orientis]MBK5949784.1 hypothetical protein [Rhodobium orientis]RAI30106.1 hypothetical protein CH339_00815 [Rhodobium orientis]